MGQQIAGSWATQQEVKQTLKETNEKDEQKALYYLAAECDTASQSSRMRINWGLNRTKIKNIMAHMAEGRILHATFGNLMGATRFETREQGEVWHTMSPKCKKYVDNWSHCVDCHQLEVGEIKNEKQWLANTKVIIRSIRTDPPAKYVATNIRHERYVD